jgi:phosphohistidine phosphatase
MALSVAVKELLILRHAKAANDSESGRDFDRALNEQGRAAADFMGQYLLKHQELPDLVCCSDATRTRETFVRMMAKLPRPLPVSYQNGLYLASAGDLLDYVNAIPEAASRVMLVGHNPGMHHLARILAGSGDAEAMSALEYKFPTCGLALIQFPSDMKWEAILPNSGKLLAFWRPKLLMTEG